MPTDNPNGRIPTPAWKWPDGESMERIGQYLAYEYRRKLVADRDELLAALDVAAQLRLVESDSPDDEYVAEWRAIIARIRAGK